MSRVEGKSATLAWLAETQGDLIRIVLNGELDLESVEHAKPPLLEFVAANDGLVVVDLADVVFMDSSGLRMLIEIRNDLDDVDRRLVLGPVSDAAERVIDVAGVNQWFERFKGEAPV